MTGRTRKATRLVGCLLGAGMLGLFAPAQAIIIRHDKSYSDYRAAESEFPAVFFLEKQESRKVCVATLIAPGWAITAAHCAFETGLLAAMDAAEPFPVRVAGRQRLIERLVLHPRFQPDSPTDVDLALLKFSSLTGLPEPIALNSHGEESGQVVTLLGWGFFGIGTTGRRYDDGQFRFAQNRIERAGRRLQILFDDPRAQNSGALALEGMPGLGDSGGPALLRNGDDWVLAGVAVGEIMAGDFSEETQGSYGSVAVYERVSRHLEWIRLTISDNSGTASE